MFLRLTAPRESPRSWIDFTAMPPRKRGTPSDGRLSDAGPTAKQIRTGELLSTGVTKTALVKIVESLHKSGHLKVTLTRDQVKRQIQSHATFVTPHGLVVQKMDIGGHTVEYIHPAALIYYLCAISAGFRTVMSNAVAAAAPGPCNIVLYSDAATPGNVFRPDKGRKFEAFYWCHHEIHVVCMSTIPVYPLFRYVVTFVPSILHAYMCPSLWNVLCLRGASPSGRTMYFNVPCVGRR